MKAKMVVFAFMAFAFSVHAEEAVQATSEDLKEFDQLLEKGRTTAPAAKVESAKSASPRDHFNAPPSGVAPQPPAMNGDPNGRPAPPPSRTTPGGPAQPPDLSGRPPPPAGTGLGSSGQPLPPRPLH